MARIQSVLKRATNVAMVTVLAACSPGIDLPVLSLKDASSYRLGPGDKVRIIVYGEEQLSNEFRVESSGDLTLPLLNQVHAQGLTTKVLADVLEKNLDQRKIIHGASVSIEVSAYRPFFILGEVNKPGEYPYQPGMTMLTAVAIAGGFTNRAIEDRAYVVRNAEGAPVEGQLKAQSLVAPGDALKVYERLF